MEYRECGAALPGDETCQDRFHALLVAEQHNAGLARMHGLTVLTYHLQHPSLTKAWYQAAGYDTMRRGFGQGRDWWEALSEGRRWGPPSRRRPAGRTRTKRPEQLCRRGSSRAR